jgi:S1-C subfamily serine protease
MKKSLLPLILMVLGVTAAFAQQVLPTGSLAVPVLITLSNGETASGFYLDCSNHLFLATARHVLFAQDSRLKSNEAKLSSSAFTMGEPESLLTVNLGILESNKQIRAHPSHDVAVVRLARRGSLSGFDFDLRVVKPASNPKGGFATVRPDMIRHFADVVVGEDVFVFGYPTSIGLRQSPKFDYSKPLLRKGIVSAVYPKTQTIILDSSVYFGNSGGPVMEVSRFADANQFKVVGIVSEMIPFMDVWENKRFNYTTANLSNSGYSVVEPVDYLIELTWD